MAKPTLTHNHYFISLRQDRLFIGMMPAGGMDKEHALNLAAWLVAMARVLPGDLEFGDMIEAVEGHP